MCSRRLRTSSLFIMSFLYKYPIEPVLLDPTNDNDEEQRKDDHKTETSRAGRRRSKNDQNGRSYKCGCGKMYLSYPALYTHIKTKHDMVQPAGTYGPQFRNGRGRGRPRKMKETTEPAPAPQTHPSDNIRKNPNFADEISFVRELGAYSDSPTSPASFFPIVYSHNCQMEHPLLARLRQVQEHAESVKQGQYVQSDTCTDYALAVFLWEHSQVCKPDFYCLLVHLVTALHKFLNEEVEADCTRCKDPGELPAHSNEFMTYLQGLTERLDQDKIVLVWRHLCEWLYVHGHTHIRLDSK